MFDYMKSLMGTRKPINAMDYARSLDLNQKPFAEALFLRAAWLIDSAAIEVDVQLPSYENADITRFAETAIITIAFSITELSGKLIGQSVVYLPDDPVPTNSSLVVAYSLSVAAILTSHLKNDGISCDFDRLATELAGQPFTVKATDERVQHAMAGINTFKQLASADYPKIIEWHGLLAKLIPMYVVQWTSQDQNVRNTDLSNAFAGLLRSLLKVSN
jgi:hypothetical protein